MMDSVCLTSCVFARQKKMDLQLLKDTIVVVRGWAAAWMWWDVQPATAVSTLHHDMSPKNGRL